MNPDRTPESIAAEAARRFLFAPHPTIGTDEQLTAPLAAIILSAAREIAALEVAKSGAVEVKKTEEAYWRGYNARVDEMFHEQPEPAHPTLWRYLQNAFEKKITFHSIGANRMADGGFHFYIHPQSVSGETEDYLIWPEPFSWDDMIVNKKDSPPPNVEKFKAALLALRKLNPEKK